MKRERYTFYYPLPSQERELCVKVYRLKCRGCLKDFASKTHNAKLCPNCKQEKP